MQIADRIEQALAQAIASAQGAGAPPLLASALHYAVFPSGHRIRPQLCLAVAMACGDMDPAAADAAAASIELLHCASLVHDDLPCFDDADMRRGKASVHVQYGEPLAVLTGDALIVQAFEILARGAAKSPQRLASLLTIIAQSVGSPNGIVAGQAWESEANIPLGLYQRAKTGALFAAATAAGAASAGHDPEPWRRVGDLIGEAYQVADDLKDVYGIAEELGKPIGRDAVLGRPNAVAQLGFAGAVDHLKRLLGEAQASIPACPGADDLHAELAAQAARLMPRPREHAAA